MENITLGQMQNIVVFLTTFAGGLWAIIKAIKITIEKGLKPINDKIDRVDKNATMNYLVSRINDIDNGQALESVSKKRFYDEYEHYKNDLKGNSYIQKEVDRLEREGKL